ncbi:MAG: hypothetical protein JWN96_3355 [Mycobacterium sp.]|nr:hypothetical protein [Mycobacterium sp.]
MRRLFAVLAVATIAAVSTGGFAASGASAAVPGAAAAASGAQAVTTSASSPTLASSALHKTFRKQVFLLGPDLPG